MISPQCFEKEWIESFRKQDLYKRINPPLLEKMIHALSLLQHLQTQGLNFIFKGGTSLILLLQDANRFSVDIDIITEANQEIIEHVLDRVVAASHFTSWKLDEKRSYKAGVPKAHYELAYASNLNQSSSYILLDILFDKAHYSVIHQSPIQTKWIETASVIYINTPSIEAITGDKLTAFAPTTTGILYGKGKELEIIKQLYDLGTLFDRVTNVKDVFETFHAFATQELYYRGLSISTNEILQDILNTCRIIAFRERSKNQPDKSYFLELQNGIRSFNNFLISGHFRLEDAINSSAKIAYLCARLLTGNIDKLEKYQNEDTSDWIINNQEWNVLNRLKKFSDPSAFYYWYKALETMNLLE